MIARTTARRSFSSSSLPGRIGSPGHRRLKPAGSMAIASGPRKSSIEPARKRGGAPIRVASSMPISAALSIRPSSVFTAAVAFDSGTAQATPGMPRTRASSVSRIARTVSIYFACGSITQMLASLASLITLAVRASRPTNRPPCCMISSVAKATPKTRPRYLTLSPNSIFNATPYTIRRSGFDNPGFSGICLVWDRRPIPPHT